jgi:hypothetical protein
MVSQHLLGTSSMGSDLTGARCLNCGEPLSGPFCSRCGQRAIPAYPTLRELVGDAWQELSGYDGRVVRTFRHLMRRPGALTLEVLEGHRARYVSPVRVYLVASLIYFLVSAASPNLTKPSAPERSSSKVNIDLANPEAALGKFTPEQRAEMQKSIEGTPWWVRPALRSAVADPAAFQRRLLQNLPRALFALVPVFAAILALFYRRRPFSQHLIFALHLHAVIFLAATVGDAADFTRSESVEEVVSLVALVYLTVYVLRAFKTVYRERWRSIVLKSAGVGIVYGVACLVALVITVGVASVG